MKRSILNISVDSWDDAVQMARSESLRCGKTAIAFEYVERNSRDGMKFYECGSTSQLEFMSRVYDITRTEEFTK